MPDPPPVPFFTRFVLENPWPLGGVLLAVGVVLLVLGLRDGARSRIVAGLVSALLGASIFLVDRVVETSGEAGEALVRRVLAAVRAGDAGAAMAPFPADATLHLRSPENPGFPVERLRVLASSFLARTTVTDITVIGLRGFTVDRDRATVHLACLAATDSYGSGTTQWVFAVERGGDGTWRLRRATWVGLNGRAPSDLPGLR
ncbi:MAG: hypothetical protein KF817_11425 [Phycisphaeraceae bacterium]|nr:hypothetical protein [Phycisphaeraceae bacterium]